MLKLRARRYRHTQRTKCVLRPTDLRDVKEVGSETMNECITLKGRIRRGLAGQVECTPEARVRGTRRRTSEVAKQISFQTYEDLDYTVQSGLAAHISLDSSNDVTPSRTSFESLRAARYSPMSALGT